MQTEVAAQKIIDDFRAFIESKDREIKRKNQSYPKKVRFDVDYYYKLMEAGLLPEDNSTEIIDGELIEKMPIGKLHAGIVGKLTMLLAAQVAGKAIVWVQNPVRLNRRSEPQPDVALLKLRADFYTENHPTPTDVLLLIEVSDTTLDYDRETKIPLYAAAEIAEVWLVNLTENQIEIYTEPQNGVYQNNAIIKRGETITSATISDLIVDASEILGDEEIDLT